MRVSAAFVFFLFAVMASASAQTLVYRVDQATAVIDGGSLVVTAKGAVRSGGWDRAKLIVRKSDEPDVLHVDFVATPPEDKSAVVQSILPISGKLRMRMPSSDVATIKVVSETNSVTARIVPKKPKQKVAGKNGS